MTYTIIWMAICQLWRRQRPNGRKTYTSLWSVRDRSCLYIIRKWLQQPVYFSFRQVSLILFESCNPLECRTREWIAILMTRLHIPCNIRRRFWSMWRINTMPNTSDCQSIDPKELWASTPSPQRLLVRINILLIHMIYLALMINT